MSFEGATDGAAFETYDVEHASLLPAYKEGQIVVMDNLPKVHKSSQVRDLIEKEREQPASCS